MSLPEATFPASLFLSLHETYHPTNLMPDWVFQRETGAHSVRGENIRAIVSHRLPVSMKGVDQT
jgi:hypothetical protein